MRAGAPGRPVAGLSAQTRPPPRGGGDEGPEPAPQHVQAEEPPDSNADGYL